jgi:hypothetical protein
MTMRRKFWILSIANWALAVVMWGVSAYLGVTSPASLFLYTILFVIGIFAVIVGVLCFVAARFGTEPAASTAAETAADETAASLTAATDVELATEPVVAAVAAPAAEPALAAGPAGTDELPQEAG